MYIPEADGPCFWHVADAWAVVPWGASVSISCQEHMAGRIVSVQTLLLGIKEMKTVKPLLA